MPTALESWRGLGEQLGEERRRRGGGGINPHLAGGEREKQREAGKAEKQRSRRKEVKP